MSFFMSGVMTLVNTGFDTGFFLRWIGSFSIGYVVAYPAALLAMPIARRIVDKITCDDYV